MNKQATHNTERASAIYITVFIFVKILNVLNKFVESEELSFKTIRPLGVER